LRKLKSKSLRRICQCISDPSRGTKAEVKKELLGASWQRCKVQFMRNILARVPHNEKARFAERLKQIWTQPDARSS
jgi:transposase-like protein